MKVIGKWITVLTASLLVLIIRGFSALNRVPADQGYGIYLNAREDLDLRFVLGFNDYLNFGARLIPTVVGQLPIDWHAVAGTLLTHTVWATCSAVIFAAFRAEHFSRSSATLMSLALLLSPHASESSLGNPGTLGFPLLVALVCVCSAKSFVNRQPIGSIAFAAFVGLTTPFAILAAVPILIRLCTTRSVDRPERKVLVTLSTCLLLNVFAVGISGVLTGNDAKDYTPWDGMGLFWWSGLLAAPVVSVICISLALIMYKKHAVLAIHSLSLALTALILHFALYYLGGIADRFFVAPLSLTTMSVVVMVNLLRFGRSPVMRIALPLLVLFATAIPTVKWFFAGWYLTSGPTWTSEVQRATKMCNDEISKTVGLSISPNDVQELSCDYLLRRD